MAMRPLAESHPISQRYRDNSTIYNVGAGHGAIDIAAPVGSVIVAPEDGTVVFDGWSWNLPGGPNDWHLRWYLIKGAPGDTKAGGGIITVIRNDAGSFWGIAHASQSFLNVGDRVRKGQKIQLAGATGIATGPHSHINLWPANPNWGNGFFGAIDPEPWLDEKYAPINPGTPPKTTTDAYLNGIDVSAYQPADIVSRVPCDFVIVKTTEGAGWVNQNARQQVSDAKRLGKKVGVYHFARPLNNSSDAEAKHFVNVSKSLGVPAKDMFWVLDWEVEEAFGYTQWAHDFMAAVDKLTGTRCGLYTSTRGLTTGNWAAVDKRRPLWRAIPVMSGQPYATSFRLSAPPSGWNNLVMDQYSFFGRLPGYAADLDLNVYYGGVPQWGATGSGAAVSATGKDWFDMATESDLRRIVREEIKKNVRLAEWVDINGKKQTVNEVWSFRTKKSESLLGDVLTRLQPKALVGAVLAYVNPSEKKANPGSPDVYGKVTQVWRAITTPVVDEKKEG